MTSRLLLRPAAVADLRDAYAWYEERQRGLGAEFMEAVERKLAQIELNPWQFPAVRNVTRRAIVNADIERAIAIAKEWKD